MTARVAAEGFRPLAGNVHSIKNEGVNVTKISPVDAPT